jgi:iron complex outermembrane receptor protein
LSDGIHHGTATYERGNILLKPEKAFTVSNSIVYSNIAKTIRGELLVYTNIIQDFIYQEPQPASPVLTIAGAFPLIVYKQTNALLSGADLNLAATVIERLEWQGKFSYLRARNTSIDDWLIWMPANRMSNTATYLFKNKHKFSDTRISFEWMHVLEQKNVPASRTGPRDYMPPPAAYSLLHAGGSTTVRWGKRNIILGFSIRNMLNKAYRDYMNSMRYYSDEMGRNVIIRVKFNLDTN